MKASEAKACAASGVKDVTEIQIGIDGIAFATARSTPLANLTTRDIYAALAKTPFGKPNRAKTWKDVNARLPAIPIRVYGPPPTSGTRDAFGELVMTAGCETNAGMVALKKANADKHKAVCTGVREDGAFIEAGENDNLIVQKLAANANTVGIFGYSFLEENVSKIKGISINGVQPTYQSISSFQYPGARPLYIYVKNAHVRAIPSIRAFVAEFTKESAIGPNGYLKQLGLVAAPTSVRARSQQAARNLTPVQFAELK
jgi:phosphate transport system substrate-binding protein